MLAIVDRLDDLHTRQLLADDAKLSATFDEMRVRLLIVLAACIAVGIFLAGFTIRRTLQLESEIEKRYRRRARAPGVARTFRAAGLGAGRRAAGDFAGTAR